MVQRTYSSFRPTKYDSHIVINDREDWIVVEISRNRDSNCLDNSNFAVALRELGGESETVEVHRFGHWGPGWYEIIIVVPGGNEQETAIRLQERLQDCLVLDEDDYHERLQDEANERWKNCYNWRQRVEYMREHYEQFEESSIVGLLRCARGEFFSGWVTEFVEIGGVKA